MDDFRLIIVHVENLTNDEFRIHDSFVESTGTEAFVQPTFQRFTRLRWKCGRSRCYAAVEYGSGSSPEDGAGYGSSTSSTANATPRRRFVVAATLPAITAVPSKVGRWASNWVPGMSGAGPCFTASLSSPVNWSQSVYHHFDDAGRLADGSSDCCEWLVVRNTAEVVEVRVRLFPRDALPATMPAAAAGEGTVALVSEEIQAEQAPEFTADELEMQRLQGYRELIATLNEQAEKLDLLSEAEPMDLRRFQTLPDKARIDLLLAVLCVLCRHRSLSLDRFFDAHSGEGDELAAPLGGDEPGRGSQTPSQFMTDLPRAVSGGKNRAMTWVLPEKSEDQLQTFDIELRGHAERVFRALVPLVGFEDARTNTRVANLVRCYVPSAATPEATAPDVPSPDVLCAAVRAAINTRDDSGTDWSIERIWLVGPEHIVTRFMKSVRVIDAELASSVVGAVEGLNSGRLFCPEDCCLAFSAEEQAYYVLYRNGRAEESLQLLGVKCEEDLRHAAVIVPPRSGTSTQSSEAAPDSTRSDPLRALGERLSEIVTDREAGSPASAPSRSVSFSDVCPSSPSALPRTWLVARDFFAMTIGAGSGNFDARSRAVLYDFAAGLGVPPRLAARWENQIGGALFEMLETSSVLDKQRARRKNRNRGKVALAAAGGGVLLAVTGGLAAPVLAGAVTAAGGAAVSAGAAVGLTQAGLVLGGAIAAFGTALAGLGTAGAVVLFGATGAGLTGWKMKTRWGDLEEFEFAPLTKTTVRRTMGIEIPASDALSVKKLDEAIEAGGGTVENDMLVHGVDGAELPVLHGSRLERRECAVRTEATCVCYRFTREVDVQERAVHLAIFVTGWLQDDADFTKPWTEAAQICFPSSGHLAIRWETKGLLKLNKMFKSLVTNEVASQSASVWLKGSAAAGAAAGSIAAIAAAWPVAIISAMSNLDNAWLVSTERARLAGKCLAHVLADRQTVGQRPVTLIGHSMGARLIFYCMLELFKMNEFHAVDDVVLLGCPASTRPNKWRQVRAAASGRVVNGYLRSDWALAFFYRYLEWGLSVAGLSEVKVPGVENVHLAGLGIKGHSDYPNHIPDILAKMCVGERRLFVC